MRILTRKVTRKGKIRKRTGNAKRRTAKTLRTKTAAKTAAAKKTRVTENTAQTTPPADSMPAYKRVWAKIKQAGVFLKRHFTHTPKKKYILRELPALFSWLTVGMPFIGYKIFAGVILWRMFDKPWVHVCAAGFVALGFVDFFLHIVNFYSMCCCGRRFFSICFLSWVNRRVSFFKQKEEIGEAVDTMLSFAIVAIVVGNTLFVYLDPWQAWTWNMCTVVNVFGAGISQLQATIYAERLKQEEDRALTR